MSLIELLKQANGPQAPYDVAAGRATKDNTLEAVRMGDYHKPTQTEIDDHGQNVIGYSPEATALHASKVEIDLPPTLNQ